MFLSKNNNVCITYKPKSITPLEQLNELKKKFNITGKSCYTGRLDPMARGKMIYLFNEETKNMEKYMGFSKTYEFYIVLGISTDTYDCMGNINKINFSFNNSIIDNIINKINKGSFLSYIQEMPVFSGYKAKHKITGVKKSLWEWARKKELHNIDIPKKKISLHSFEVLYTEKMKLHDYLSIIINDISKVKNFNQDDIKSFLHQWNNCVKNMKNCEITLIKCRARVPSGTFIRFLTVLITNYSNIPCHMYDIFRTNIYKYEKKNYNFYYIIIFILLMIMSIHRIGIIINYF